MVLHAATHCTSRASDLQESCAVLHAGLCSCTTIIFRVLLLEPDADSFSLWDRAELTHSVTSSLLDLLHLKGKYCEYSTRFSLRCKSRCKFPRAQTLAGARQVEGCSRDALLSSWHCWRAKTQSCANCSLQTFLDLCVLCLHLLVLLGPAQRIAEWSVGRTDQSHTRIHLVNILSSPPQETNSC